MTDMQVRELIGRWAEAELDGDVSGLVSLLTPDFVGVGPVGFVLDRAQWAQRHLGALVNTEFTVDDLTVRSYGTTAVVTCVVRQSTQTRGHDTSGTFRVGAVVVTGPDDPPRLAQVQFSGPMVAPGSMPGFARPVGEHRG